MRAASFFGGLVYTERVSSGYALIDVGNGLRLEQWGAFRLIRPDPTASSAPLSPMLWNEVDATYLGEKGKGEWRKTRELPPEWPVDFGDVRMLVRLAPYKHTGVFPEQEKNWTWMRERAKGSESGILNLFAYTGGATMALAKDGHKVTHVDAAKPTIVWAKANADLNALAPDAVRWICEDAPVFAARELRRGNRYDGIVVDPPAFGHSPTGKTWRVERDLAPLLEQCVQLLSASPVFLVLNGYAKNDTPENFHRLLSGIFHAKRPELRFTIKSEELLLRTRDGRPLSTGIVARVSFGK